MSAANDLSNDARNLKDQAVAGAGHVADDAREELARLRDQVEKLMSERVTPALGEAADTVQDYAHRARESIEDQADGIAEQVRGIDANGAQGLRRCLRIGGFGSHRQELDPTWRGRGRDDASLAALRIPLDQKGNQTVDWQCGLLVMPVRELPLERGAVGRRARKVLHLARVISQLARGLDGCLK